MAETQHTAELPPVPFFVPSPGETDTLFVFVAVLVVASVLAFGVFFFWLHSLPERMVHNKIQFDIVAVLALLSLFTHIHAFWVAALLIALIEFPSFSLPDFSQSLGRMATSLESLAHVQSKAAGEPPEPAASEESAKPQPRTAHAEGPERSVASGKQRA